MSKMQWQVSLNVAWSSRRARSGVSLVLVSLLGWLLTMAPAYAEEPQLGAEYRPLVQKVIDAAKARDHRPCPSDQVSLQAGVSHPGHQESVRDGGPFRRGV